MIKIIINGNEFSVNEYVTILDVCNENDIYIPTLCYHEDQKLKANCRLCLVEIKGIDVLKTACSTKIVDGMEIFTDSMKVKMARKINFELLLANHDFTNDKSELVKLAKKMNISKTPFSKTRNEMKVDNHNPAIVRDLNKCIHCNRCLEVCKDVQGLHIIEKYGRSNDLEIGVPVGKCLSDMACTFCGQCAAFCPVAAISEKNEVAKASEILKDKSKHKIIQIAPSIRATICESFGVSYEEFPIEKLVAILKKIGFDEVFDTNFAADLTIIEESYELVKRIKAGTGMPMLTSCCPGWINYIEQYCPEFIDNLSTCKSPQQMFGALAKTYYADKMGKEIIVMSAMPCTAKKSEAQRDEMKGDVDIALTTREIIQLINESGIDYKNVENVDFDNPFGIASGAGAIFGNSGGVMEAALRTAYGIITGKELMKIEFNELRGIEAFKEAEVLIGSKKIKVAVVHSLLGAQQLIERIKKNPNEYTFVEVMACLGGCIGGGGQPYNSERVRNLRRKILYSIDKGATVRKSHQNQAIITLYNDFLKYPASPIAHKLLHTKYFNRKK